MRAIYNLVVSFLFLLATALAQVTPVVQTPVVQSPVVQSPVVQSPVVQSPPVGQPTGGAPQPTGGAENGTMATSGTAWITPHSPYSSSVGYLGCKLNVNRVAYWPYEISCTKLCIKITGPKGSVHVLRVDKSGGAHDISYDAFKTITGQERGGVNMQWEDAPFSACQNLVTSKDGKLGLTSANSIIYHDNCNRNSPGSPGAEAVLYNFYTPQCDQGVDQVCKINYAAHENQATCPGGVSQVANNIKLDEIYHPDYVAPPKNTPPPAATGAVPTPSPVVTPGAGIPAVTPVAKRRGRFWPRMMMGGRA